MLGTIFSLEIRKRWKTKQLKRKMKPQRYVEKCSLHQCGTQNSEKLEFQKKQSFADAKKIVFYFPTWHSWHLMRTSNQTNPKTPSSAEPPARKQIWFQVFRGPLLWVESFPAACSVRGFVRCTHVPTRAWPDLCHEVRGQQRAAKHDSTEGVSWLSAGKKKENRYFKNLNYFVLYNSSSFEIILT